MLLEQGLDVVETGRAEKAVEPLVVGDLVDELGDVGEGAEGGLFSIRRVVRVLVHKVVLHCRHGEGLYGDLAIVELESITEVYERMADCKTG